MALTSYLHSKQEVFLLLHFFPWQLWQYMNSYVYKLAAYCHRLPIITLHSE